MVVAIIESDTLRDCGMRTGHEEAEPGSLSSLQIARCMLRFGLVCHPFRGMVRFGLVW